MRSFNKIILLSFVLFTTAACVIEPDYTITSSGTDSTKEIRISMIAPGKLTNGTTRAITQAEENNIQTVDVLAFRIDGTNETFDYQATGTLTANNTPGAATQTFTVDVRVRSWQQRFVVITNARPQMSALLASNPNWAGASKTTMLAGLRYNLAGGQDRWNATSPSNYARIPMWGESAAETIYPVTTNLSSQINLMRMVARIDVKLDTTVAGLTDQFKLRSVALYNTNTGGHIVPDPARVVPGPAVNGPTVPTELQPYAARHLGPINYTDFAAPGIVDVAMIGAIYTFEAAATTNPAEATCLVVGGLYGSDTTPSYYKIELVAQSSQNRLAVLRNNHYIINISGIRTRGHATPDEAFRSTAVNVTANVLVWNQPGMNNVVVNEQYALATDRSGIVLGAQAYTAATEDNVVRVFTDLPAGWTVERIVDGADGTTPVTWATASPMAGPVNTSTNMVISATQNTTGANRSAIVWLAAGRLRMPIPVTQTFQVPLSLSLLNNSGQEITELVFNQTTADVAPTPQILRVNWQPAAQPVTVTSVQESGSSAPFPDPATGVYDGAPYNNMPWSWNTGTHDFNIAPPALTTAELNANPFINKRTRYFMTASNGSESVLKQILISHLRYTLRVEPPATGTNPLISPYAAMGNTNYRYNVRSNYTWRIRSVTEYPRLTGVPLMANTATDNVRTDAIGVVNTTPGGGVVESFTTGPTRGNSGYADVVYTPAVAGQTADVTQRLFFTSPRFTIYGIASMPGGTGRAYNIYTGYNNNEPPNATPAAAYDAMSLLLGDANFGTTLSGTGATATPVSTVFTQQPAISGFNINDNSQVSVQNINSAVSLNADMLFISGSSTFDATVAQAIRTNFLDRNKPVVLMIEDIVTVRQMLAACRIDTDATAALTNWNGTAPVYQFVDIPGDPILHGPFAANLGNQYWGNDGIGSWVLWFTSQANKSQVIMYSNMNNYTGTTWTTTPPAGETTSTGMTCFRLVNYPLVVCADGGFISSYDQTSNWQTPMRINPTTKVPIPANNYGGGTPTRTVMNSAFLGNLIAWGIQRRTTQ